jgi:hypothetical protein
MQKQEQEKVLTAEERENVDYKKKKTEEHKRK